MMLNLLFLLPLLLVLLLVVVPVIRCTGCDFDLNNDFNHSLLNDLG